MKVRLHLAMFALAMLPMLTWAQSENEEPKQKQIQLTFQGAGDTKTVETVTVENLSRGTSITVNGSEILVLDPAPTGIEDTQAGFGGTEPLLYPNPAEGDGNLVFDVQQEGEVAVRIFSMDGVLMESANVPVFEGRNALSIPSQGYGFFMVSVEGNGIHFSQKWMCGAPNSGNGIRHNGTSDVELPKEAIAMTRAQAPESKTFEYQKGDVLRFTATTGNMKTIVVQKPEINHTITFQMFKCQDANGYNYPIIEAGGMLWMAEDLRPVKMDGIAIAKNAQYWTDPKANALRMAYANYDDKNKDQGAYYTPKAAVKALPEGWKLPTADELKLVQETFGGADKAAAALKAHGDDSNWGSPSYDIDEVQVNLGANGMLQADGTFTGIGTTATVVTRNFNDGLPHIMNMSDGSDATELTLGLVAKAGEAFTVRGVRPAMSAYNGFISNWLSTNPEQAPRRIEGKDLYAGLDGNPFAYTAPLGQKYTVTSGADQYVFWGKLFEGEKELGQTFETTDINQLSRLVGQNMQNGLQRTVRLSWSNKSSGWGDEIIETMYGSGTIKIEVVGNATEPDFSYEGIIDKGFTFPGIKIFGMPRIVQYSGGGFTITSPAGDYRNREQIQSSLQAQCADFNGDGIDDILTGMGSKFVIIDGANYKQTLLEKDYSVSKDQGFGEISCAAGDINKDGITDLVVLHQDATNVILEAWWGGLESFSGKSNNYLTFAREDYLTHGVVIGDFNADGNMDVILQLLNEEKQQIHMLSYSRDNDRLEAPITKNFTNSSFSNREMALVRSRGLVKSPFLFASGQFFEWNDLDNTFDKAKMAVNSHLPVLSGSFAVGNFDNDQDGKEQLIAIRLYHQVRQEQGSTIINWFESPDVAKFTYRESKQDIDYSVIQNVMGFLQIRGQKQDIDAVILRFPLYFYSLGSIRYKNPIREAELSSIETTMSEPRIYALLAAPPYWADYKDDYENAGGTVWGKSKSSGGGTSTETSHTGSAIFGFEQEFNLPLVAQKVGGIDFETRLDFTTTQSQQKTTMTEYGIQYNNIWQDAVVLSMVPYTAYNYVITKSGNEEEIGNTLMIGMPDKPRTMMVTLDNYMSLRADNTSIPNLSELFQHEPGNPWSYKEKYVDAMPITADILWGNNSKTDMITGGSGGNTTLSIAVTTEMESTSENEFAMDITLVGTAFGVKAGGGYGYSNKNGVTHKEEVGMEVSGTVPGPKSIEDVKAFQWNMCRANVKFGGQHFPVVTYIVQQ